MPPQAVRATYCAEIYLVRFEHFKLEGYDPHGAIKMEMAV